MSKIQLFVIAVALTIALCQGSEFPPVPMNSWYTSEDLPFQEGTAQEGKLCTSDKYYCMNYVLQDDGCYFYSDQWDDEYTVCLDDQGNQVSGIYRSAYGYVEEFERLGYGYLFWDDGYNTWFESFDGLSGYSIYEGEEEYYYEEWLTDEDGTYQYYNSYGESTVSYPSGNYYSYYSNGDIDYYSAVDEAWYTYRASEDKWYIDDWYSYVEYKGEPVFYTWESSMEDVEGGSRTSMDDIQDWKVDIDSEALGPLIEDILAIEGQKIKIVEQVAEQLLYDLEDSYYEILGQVIINLGRSVVPIGEASLEILDMMSVNEDCDTYCGAQCFDPWATESFFMDPWCMESCGCHFKITNMKKRDITDNLDDLFVAVGEGMYNFQKTAWYLLDEIQPTIDLFLSEISDLKNEYADKLHYHAINTFGCEPMCSEDCTINSWYYPLYQNRCLRDWCDCTELPITIEPPEDMNLYELEDYFASLVDLLHYITYVVHSSAASNLK